MNIYPRKVRHLSPSRDDHLPLAAKYLHIDIFDQKPKESWNFRCLISLRAMSCEVFPLFGDQRLHRAGRGSRRFRASRQRSH